MHAAMEVLPQLIKVILALIQSRWTLFMDNRRLEIIHSAILSLSLLANKVGNGRCGLNIRPPSLQ